MDHPYTDRFWTSPDGLKLHYRDYAGRDDRPPVLCMHGLTRNARDFAPLAEHLAGDWRVIVPEMRGRGESEYAKDISTYNPLTYVADVEALLAELAIDRFIAIGTSMGGLMTMILAAKDASRLVAATLNDIGPQLEQAGLDRITTYVGHSRSFPTWMHAARATQETHGDFFPEYTIERWLEIAKRLMVVGQNGRISLDYDMAIAEPFKQPENVAPADMWPAFEALRDTPLLVLRGGISDLLSEASLAEMKRRLPHMATLTMPNLGHAPALDEPEAIAAIDRLLASTL